MPDLLQPEPAIDVRRLGKRYRLVGLASASDPTPSVPRHRMPFSVPSPDVWALRDVTFSVNHGEVLGIIGRNGSGKTTLLKVLGRVTAPTEGEAILRGRVGALQVGTGFHSELSGRDNVILSGLIMGMNRPDIDASFDDIVAFADIGPYIDVPVKYYSNGMRMRLAFSVCVQLKTDILLIDEVMAAGDESFSKRANHRINELIQDGRTVLMTTHIMSTIQDLCRRSIVIDAGRLVFDGPTSDAIITYRRL